MKKLFTQEQEKEICDLYLQGQFGSCRLAKRFNCDRGTIVNVIHRNGFKLKAIKEAHKGKFGSQNSCWRGGRTKTESGYVLIYDCNHPFRNARNYVLEHRLVMERYLGRYLKSEEVVHHINGMLHDNRIENLMLFGGIAGKGDHSRFHLKGKPKQKTPKVEITIEEV